MHRFPNFETFNLQPPPCKLASPPLHSMLVIAAKTPHGVGACQPNEKHAWEPHPFLASGSFGAWVSSLTMQFPRERWDHQEKIKTQTEGTHGKACPCREWHPGRPGSATFSWWVGSWVRWSVCSLCRPVGGLFGLHPPPQLLAARPQHLCLLFPGASCRWPSPNCRVLSVGTHHPPDRHRTARETLARHCRVHLFNIATLLQCAIWSGFASTPSWMVIQGPGKKCKSHNPLKVAFFF